MLIIEASANVYIECQHCAATADTNIEIEDAGDFATIPARALAHFRSLGWEGDDDIDTEGVCPWCVRSINNQEDN